MEPLNKKTVLKHIVKIVYIYLGIRIVRFEGGNNRRSCHSAPQGF